MNIIACVFNDIRGKPTSSGRPYVIQHEFRRADKGNDMLYDQVTLGTTILGGR